MKSGTIRAREGDAVPVPTGIYEELAQEGDLIARNLKLRLGGVTRLSGALRFDNMIGSIVTRRASIELAPKTDPGQNWIHSVLDLLDDRPIAVSNDAPASDSASDASFMAVIAKIFSGRLSDALAVEGAITAIMSTYSRSPVLSGRLRVNEWILRASYDGHRFPVDQQVLSADNAYAQTLAYVGRYLAQHTPETRVRRQLLECVETLTGGREVAAPPANAIGLDLPVQWGAYDPAWTIAQMVLKQRARFGPRSLSYGMSLVIEPWILLERLVERTLKHLAQRLSISGEMFTSRAQKRAVLLSGSIRENSIYSRPDCVLFRGGVPIVNCEAKYRDYARTDAPLPEEVYQAVTAGRALGTLIAVLVYPNTMPSRTFTIQKSGHPPETLVILGVDMFGYRKSVGERERANKLLPLLENIIGTCIMSADGEMT
ncbi:5-methylcytosine restriction system specificity protein McrC [Acidiphilium acidophilum]|uniref:5-methylcytosine restriction system specificity protein McrC n=1 Tax=Acidiphilium acidophilum TaxID=76588 RepID=UPI002E8E68ED|nr:hypothetical protein [Acidiphilium acidophilum]